MLNFLDEIWRKLPCRDYLLRKGRCPFFPVNISTGFPGAEPTALVFANARFIARDVDIDTVSKLYICSSSEIVILEVHDVLEL